jgi:hypothetical protein
MPQHVFYDDNALLDLRYLAAAEPFDHLEDDQDEMPWGIGCVLEVAYTPQHVSFRYRTRQDRDDAFARLIALHQAWLAHQHADDAEYDA